MKKTNVIYILVDDMGYGDFGLYNNNLTCTDHLNALSKQGVTLNQCYSSSPVCGPARASIMTGRYPQRTGVIDTLESRGLDRLKPAETTMADVFKYNGYRTALVGKWHLGAIGDDYHPQRRGFDEFYGFRGGWTDYYNYKNLEHNGVAIESDGTYLTDLLTDKAIDYIKEFEDEAFFLHLAYTAPHFPFQAPEALVEKYSQQGKFTTRVAQIYAMIEAMDHGVGRILDELKNLGIEDNTIVIFTSDNGPDFHGQGDDCGKRYNADLHGEKMLVYEGGIKVPAIVKWQGVLAENLQCDEVISHMDWLPTLIDMCQLNVEETIDFDGINVQKALRGGMLDSRKLYWQWNRYYPVLEGNAAMREGNLKLVHPPIKAHLDLPRWEIAVDEDIKVNPRAYDGIINAEVPKHVVPISMTQELYDLSQDESEEHDLSGEQEDVVISMEKQLRHWFDQVEKDRLS